MAQRPQRLRTHGTTGDTRLAQVVELPMLRVVTDAATSGSDQNSNDRTESAGVLSRRDRRWILGTVAASGAVFALFTGLGGGDHERPEPTISSIDAATIGIENPDGLDSGVVRGGQLMVDAPEAPIAPPNPSQAP